MLINYFTLLLDTLLTQQNKKKQSCHMNLNIVLNEINIKFFFKQFYFENYYIL